jgi:hypothetical protein
MEQDRSPAMGQLAAAYRERIDTSVDFALELLALGGMLPDFDLLIVSLHSSNPKVRANAIEAIASGAGHANWRLLEPLIHRREGRRRTARLTDEEIVPLLEDAIAKGHYFEVAAAAQALRDYQPEAQLTLSLRAGMKPGMPAMVRESFAAMLSLDRAPRPTTIDMVEALRQEPDFADAAISALLSLAEHLSPERIDSPAIELEVGGRPYWLARSHVDAVAVRYPEFGLVLLKAQDGRSVGA